VVGSRKFDQEAINAQTACNPTDLLVFGLEFRFKKRRSADLRCLENHTPLKALENTLRGGIDRQTRIRDGAVIAILECDKGGHG
jgi:hypothetical protein